MQGAEGAEGVEPRCRVLRVWNHSVVVGERLQQASCSIKTAAPPTSLSITQLLYLQASCSNYASIQHLEQVPCFVSAASVTHVRWQLWVQDGLQELSSSRTAGVDAAFWGAAHVVWVLLV